MAKLPGVNHQEAIRAFRRVGYWISHQGKHIKMTNGTHTVIIPRNNPINAFTLGKIIEGAGMTVEAFRKLL